LLKRKREDQKPVHFCSIIEISFVNQRRGVLGPTLVKNASGIRDGLLGVQIALSPGEKGGKLQKGRNEKKRVSAIGRPCDPSA